MIPMKDGLYNVKFINEETNKVHALDSMPDGQYRVVSNLQLDKQDNNNYLNVVKKDDQDI